MDIRMFSTIFKFELTFWLRAMMVYVFTFIVGLLIFAAVSSENVSVGMSGSMETTYRNAPHAIQIFYGVMALFTILMTTAFVNGAASRDFAHNTHQLIYTKPIEKFGFLMGRFWGSTLIAIIPLLGISVGIILAQFMPWVEPEYWGPICWPAHFWSVVIFAIPNTILVSAIIFAIAVWTRSTIASFVGALLLLVGYTVASSFSSNLDNETLGMMIDPFGVEAFDSLTKYWTADERNTQWMTLSGMLLWNRLLWLAVSMGILGVAYWRFSFTERMRSGRAQAVDKTATKAVAIPTVGFRHGFGANLAQLWSQIRIDFAGIIKSNVFIVVAIAFTIQICTNLYFLASEGFGLSSLPVTYNVIAIIRASSFIFLIGTIVFYAGTLVWREREAELDEVYDASPQPTWISYAAKLFSLILLILVVQGVGMCAGLISQAAQGYHRFQISQYLTELFVVDFVSLFCLGVLAMFAHVVSPNKYFGYFFFILLVVLNLFGWGFLEVETRMVRYGSIPGHTYSDMYGFAPFVPAMRGFYIYWMLFTGIISSFAILLWQRGKERGFGSRLKIAGSRWTGVARWASLAFLLAWSASAYWVYHNVKVLNEFTTSEVQTDLRADYEKQFKAEHEGVAQPRITDVKYDIDVYPEERSLRFHGVQTIENKSDGPIEKIFISVNGEYENELIIGEEGRATIAEEFEDFDYFTYQLDPPMAVGETMEMEYTVSYKPTGFENSVSNTSIVQNGTFFNNMIAPQMGYQSGYELSSRKERKERDLEPQQTMPLFDPDNLKARANTYLDPNSDWLEVETTISTSSDQMAIAPGTLQKSWEEDGRRYFHYKLDHPSLNFFSFISARYAVEARQWGDVDISVYYHPDHGWNVPNMLESIKKSLEYYTENFGPYKHKQARIIEFPRVASFAQAFPGTMPYSEGIGFIADIKEEDDIDMVFYVVAHEMAHQWWAHQVIGADMQGATLLSETLAQYSALMVMEKQYGRDIMRKFLKYEMDNYLRARGSEGLKEQPLKTVEAGQGYIHYRKGSCVMYYLKEMIGEEQVNKALRAVIDKFAYQPPPYPTSLDLIDALKAETPEEYRYLFNDLFETITLFANRTTEATYKEREDGKYDVTIEIECKKFQAGEKGKETEIDINDWIEIGAFAKPEKDRKYGRTLHRERKQVTATSNTFTFTVELEDGEELGEAGVDPFALLIDRMPNDNLKKLKEAG
jgi:ABC-type transport system involved in multi-copper enzyme maturation permease subunit